MGLHRGYEPARSCTDGPTPGARALMSWILGAYAGRGAINLGIFNCRAVRGGKTTSLHGEGRAIDPGIRPHGADYGGALAEQLRLHSAELGVQLIIWDRRIWSGSQPDAGWRPYRGVSPHVDHIHVELSRHAAATLTVARVQEVLGGSRPRTLALTSPRMRGDDVGALQRALRIDDDGVFGPATERAVRTAQDRHRLTIDGKVGPATRRALGL